MAGLDAVTIQNGMGEILMLSNVLVSSDRVTANINGGSAQAYPEITLGPDLTVLSTRVLGEDWPDVIRQ